MNMKNLLLSNCVEILRGGDNSIQMQISESNGGKFTNSEFSTARLLKCFTLKQGGWPLPPPTTIVWKCMKNSPGLAQTALIHQHSDSGESPTLLSPLSERVNEDGQIRAQIAPTTPGSGPRLINQKAIQYLIITHRCHFYTGRSREYINQPGQWRTLHPWHECSSQGKQTRKTPKKSQLCQEPDTSS